MFVCLDIKKERIERSKKVEKYCAISSIHARHSNENIFFSIAQFFFFFSIDKYISTKRISFLLDFYANCCMLSYGEHVILDLFSYRLYFVFGEDKGRIMKLSHQSSNWTYTCLDIDFSCLFLRLLYFERRKKILNLFFPEIKINILLSASKYLDKIDFISVLFLIYSIYFIYNIILNSNLNILYWYTM